ncbi:MAG TPA: aminotransferase class V-fold PLP-dependent enzyme [Candidatus Limnocylindrales bacterium]|nr:aminotransferase class V-fold PLP-dependent enzyme [Candidatus Limnocylindrales bacterium]
MTVEGAAPADLESIRALFHPGVGITYLDTATYGLPPQPTVDALEGAIRAWQAGTADWMEDWDRPTDRARDDFASLIGVEANEIAMIPAASVGAGLVAAQLRPGDEVVVPVDEFTSTLFPILVAGERGAVVREVPFEAVDESVGPATRLVAFSLVQMQTGRVADIGAILGAAERAGAQVLVDATQGIPAFDLAPYMARIDYLVCAAYKHLLCPRGTAFLRVRSDRWPEVEALNANWHAAPDAFGRYFGGPLTLADDARRFDVSRAWFPWVGATESLRLLAEWSRAGVLDEVRRLARGLAARLDVPWPGASLVCAPIANAEAARAGLRAAGVRASVRGTAIRFAVHVYNTDADLDRAAEAIAPFMPR